MTAPALDVPAVKGPEDDADRARAATWRLARRPRVAVPILVVVVLALATVLTRGRVEGVRGSAVGMSNMHPGDVVSVGQLLIRDRGPGAATILLVRAQGDPDDLRGLTIGPALLGSPGVGLERGFPPSAAAGDLRPAEGAILPPGDEQAPSDLILRVEVLDSRVHRIQGVEVTYWQYGRVHRVRTGPDVLLCPQDCPIDLAR